MNDRYRYIDMDLEITGTSSGTCSVLGCSCLQSVPPLPSSGVLVIGDPGMRKKDVEEKGGGTLQALPTPTLPSWMTVGRVQPYHKRRWALS